MQRGGVVAMDALEASVVAARVVKPKSTEMKAATRADRAATKGTRGRRDGEEGR